MKNKILYLLIAGIIFLIPKSALAVTVSTNCSSSSSATLGNIVSVTVTGNSSDSVMWDLSISYDSSKLQYIGGNPTHYVSDNFSSSISLTYRFKTIALGNAVVKVANAEVATATGDSANSNNASCSINIVNASSSPTNAAKKSSDNNLKLLEVEGAVLNPEFNKDILEYNVELSSDTTKIKVNADKSDSKASISGIGEIEVKEGQNRLEIIVTAENGSSKTYVINANVLEKEPINVKVGKENYTLIRKTGVIEPPEGYNETKVTINDEEIPAYTNEVSGYTLVGLRDSNGNASWYIFDSDELSYTKYLELKSNSIRLVLLKPDNENVPYRYYKSKFDFEGNNIDGYVFNEGSDFRLIYGMNIETGEKAFYLYDLKDKTIQRFYNEQVLIYINLVKKCKILFLVFTIAIMILFISVILALSKNIKFKKQYLAKMEYDEEISHEDVVYQDIEGTKVIDPIDNIIDEGSKKSNKSKKKTFLDE